MVSVKEDLTGMIFGRLTVLCQADDHIYPSGARKAQWLCECSCSEHNLVVVTGQNLKKQNGTRSCGCLQVEAVIKLNHEKRKGNVVKLNLEDEHGLYGIGYCSNTNREFYFDMDDYDKIKNYTWHEHVTQNNYHCLCSYDPDSQTIIRMHYLIADKHYDHRDRNALNNRKHNLRAATHQENTQNATKRKDNTSGIIGVNWHKTQCVWHASIRNNGKKVHIGSFRDKRDAIVARLQAEAKYYREFAPQRHLFKEYKINVKGEE